jgi:hypothetical protein
MLPAAVLVDAVSSVSCLKHLLVILLRTGWTVACTLATVCCAGCDNLPSPRLSSNTVCGSLTLGHLLAASMMMIPKYVWS